MRPGGGKQGDWQSSDGRKSKKGESIRKQQKYEKEEVADNCKGRAGEKNTKAGLTRNGPRGWSPRTWSGESGCGASLGNGQAVSHEQRERWLRFFHLCSYPLPPANHQDVGPYPLNQLPSPACTVVFLLLCLFSLIPLKSACCLLETLAKA